MNYAIELVFDDDCQNVINEIRKKLNENGVHDEAVILNHVSIGDYKTDNIEELKKRVTEFSKTIKPFEISLVSVGTFMTKGHVIFITSIVKNIKDKWLSFSYDFPENHKDLTQCQNLKLLIKDNNIILHDYNWTNDDYERAIKDSGLRIKEIHIPMGNNNDPYKWLSEKTVPYNYIYILE